MHFEFHKPATVQEAVGLLGRYGETAKVISGGTSLVLFMREKMIQPEHLISLEGIKELDFIECGRDGSARMGALTRHRAIERSAALKEVCSVLCEMESDLGSVQLRNRGTIGGSLSHGEPLSDPPTVLAGLGAVVTLVGPRGTREIAVDSFYKGYYETELAEGEILTEVKVPALPANSGCAYFKLTSRKAMDKPYVGVCVRVTLDESKRVVKEARIALGAVADRPTIAVKAAELLKGRKVAEVVDGLAAEAGKLAMEGLEPVSDVRCSGDYKKRMVGVMVNRMVAEAIRRAQG
jgi:CO/xanthine dehydrogenase FAD-binding subunit